jgi:hypothetical protein
MDASRTNSFETDLSAQFLSGLILAGGQQVNNLF